MFYKALLLLLPAVAYAQVNIRVDINDYKELSYMLSGTTTHHISEKERDIWQVNDEQLKELVQNWFFPDQTGPRPDEVYVRHPDDKPNMYKVTKGFLTEVLRTVVKEGIESKGIRYESVILATKNYYNSKDNSVNYTVGKIEQSVEETVSTTWLTPDSELAVGKVDCEFIVRKWNVPDFSFIGSWGKNDAISKTATVLSESGVAVELKPGELVVAALIASRGTIKINLKFKAYLWGNVVARCKNGIVDIMNYFIDIKKMLKKSGKRVTVFPEVEIKFVFYAEPQIIVSKNWTWTSVHPNTISNRINF